MVCTDGLPAAGSDYRRSQCLAEMEEWMRRRWPHPEEMSEEEEEEEQRALVYQDGNSEMRRAALARIAQARVGDIVQSSLLNFIHHGSLALEEAASCAGPVDASARSAAGSPGWGPTAYPFHCPDCEEECTDGGCEDRRTKHAEAIELNPRYLASKRARKVLNANKGSCAR